ATGDVAWHRRVSGDLGGRHSPAPSGRRRHRAGGRADGRLVGGAGAARVGWVPGGFARDRRRGIGYSELPSRGPMNRLVRWMGCSTLLVLLAAGPVAGQEAAGTR